MLTKKLQSLLGCRPNIAQSHSLIYGFTLVSTLAETWSVKHLLVCSIVMVRVREEIVMKMIKKKILTVNL